MSHLHLSHLSPLISLPKCRHLQGSRIVGFEVEPFSVKHGYAAPFDPAKPLITCTKEKPMTHDLPPQPVSTEGEVIFTYDVRWE